MTLSAEKIRLITADSIKKQKLKAQAEKARMMKEAKLAADSFIKKVNAKILEAASGGRDYYAFQISDMSRQDEEYYPPDVQKCIADIATKHFKSLRYNTDIGSWLEPHGRWRDIIFEVNWK